MQTKPYGQKNKLCTCERESSYSFFLRCRHCGDDDGMEVVDVRDHHYYVQRPPVAEILNSPMPPQLMASDESYYPLQYNNEDKQLQWNLSNLDIIGPD